MGKSKVDQVGQKEAELAKIQALLADDTKLADVKKGIVLTHQAADKNHDNKTDQAELGAYNKLLPQVFAVKGKYDPNADLTLAQVEKNIDGLADRKKDPITIDQKAALLQLVRRDFTATSFETIKASELVAKHQARLEPSNNVQFSGEQFEDGLRSQADVLRGQVRELKSTSR